MANKLCTVSVLVTCPTSRGTRHAVHGTAHKAHTVFMSQVWYVGRAETAKGEEFRGWQEIRYQSGEPFFSTDFSWEN